MHESTIHTPIALVASARREIEPAAVPTEEEEEGFSEQSEDEDDVPLKQLLEMRVGLRKSARAAAPMDRGAFLDPEVELDL